MILLVLFSGDPITRLMGKYALFVASMVVFATMYNKIKRDFYTFFSFIGLGVLTIFVFQYLVLGFVSWLGAFNYINTIFFGSLIIYLLAERFTYQFFMVMSYISIISLILYIPINLLSIKIPGFVWGTNRITYIIYTFVKEHQYRNCGLFWEPGAFAGMLTLCMALNVKQLPILWKAHRSKVIAIVLALMLTQSTTGYVVFFLIGCYYMLFFVRDKSIAFTLLPLVLVAGIVVYTNAAFLKDKVERQSEASLSLSQGEFSNTRFGSFIFDMHYIKQHPIIGNGFNEITRYKDNPELIQRAQMGLQLANGNGLSNYIACLGIPFVFIYLLLSFRAITKIDYKTGVLVTLVITLSLISEQWLDYPLFLGIMFIRNKKFV